jgi:MerR family transcriptional regulator, light-induced transcriptional regulator
VSADTLRIWERRYGFPKPLRNDSQIRVYSDDDVERLMLVARSLKAGFRAGEVIHRSVSELRQLIAGSVLAQPSGEAESPTLEAIVGALEKDDFAGLRTELRRAAADLGPKRFVMELAGPLVDRVGMEWAAGRLEVHQEHLLSEVLSTQLRLLLGTYDDAPGDPVIVLTTLSNELHGLGIEMAALYLAIEGAAPRLLGLNTPPHQIVEAAAALGARAVGLSISPAADKSDTQEQIARLLRELPAHVELWLGGKASSRVDPADPRAQQVVTWTDVDAALGRLRAQSNTTVLLP